MADVTNRVPNLFRLSLVEAGSIIRLKSGRAVGILSIQRAGESFRCLLVALAGEPKEALLPGNDEFELLAYPDQTIRFWLEQHQDPPRAAGDVQQRVMADLETEPTYVDAAREAPARGRRRR